jgi:putative nucleotidyltransferase with HDIG domain
MESEVKEKILFVDDEESILNVSSDFFQRRGYQTRAARSAKEALQILEEETVDCCFTDINMPEMNGLDLAEKIRMLDNTLPVIVMTGYPSLENAIQTIKNGVVDFLIKPVNLKQMELSVRRVLERRRLLAENVILKKEIEGKERLEKVNQELVLKVEELLILNKIMSNFAAISSTTDVFKRAVDTAIEIVNAHKTYFYVINDAVQQPVEVASAKAEVNSTSAADSKAVKTYADGSEDFDRIGGVPSTIQLIMEVAADGLPLLISDNNGAKGLPASILSAMFVPLKIREKVFGVLMGSIYKGEKRFSEKDLYYLSFMTQSAAHAIENLALYENIYENLFATLYAFVKAVEARDLYTRQHSSRVTGISLILGKKLGCTREELDILNFAGHLHDIGKIGIRDDILLKPGRLTPEEFEKIKEHPVIGANILEHLGLWEKEKLIIRYHHERFDGTGYPDGLRLEEIPFLARILSVADVYDAMASDRAYRKKMEENSIIKIIKEGAGTQFDPVIVAVFLDAHEEGLIQRYMQTGQIPHIAPLSS